MKTRRTTEPKWTAALLARLREQLGPKYTVLKHSDRFTSNVPDFSVSRKNRTLWIEVKVLREKHDEDEITNPHLWVDKHAQLHLTQKLEGWYIVHDPFNQTTMLLDARDIDLSKTIVARSCTISAEHFSDLLLKLVKDKL